MDSELADEGPQAPQPSNAAPSTEVAPGTAGSNRALTWLRSAWRPPSGAELSTGRVAAYGVGAYTFVILSDVPGFFLNPFLLEVVLMDAATAGNLLLIAKVGTRARHKARCSAITPSLGRRRACALAALLPCEALAALPVQSPSRAFAVPVRLRSLHASQPPLVVGGGGRRSCCPPPPPHSPLFSFRSLTR